MYVGSSSHNPIWQVDPAYKNIGRVREHQRKDRKALEDDIEAEVHFDVTNSHGGLYDDASVLQGSKGSTPSRPDGRFGDIAAIEEQSNCPVLVWEDSQHKFDGGVIMQTAQMRQRLKLSEGASEVDAIEGFLDDNRFARGIVVLTSTYCSLLGKFTPTMAAILYGRTSAHYRRYFRILIRSMDYADFKQFTQDYKGMICDLSGEPIIRNSPSAIGLANYVYLPEAERIGFEQALTDLFDVPIDEITIEQFYVYCQIHFLRSESKFRRNDANVPKTFKNDFRMRIRELLDPNLSTEMFWDKCRSLKRDYPKCRHWLDWHTSELRVRKTFPCLAREPFVGDHANTNGQESMGRTLQSSFDEPKATVSNVFIHIKRFLLSFDLRWNMAVMGEPSDYRLSPTKVRVCCMTEAIDKFISQGHTNSHVFSSKAQKTQR